MKNIKDLMILVLIGICSYLWISYEFFSKPIITPPVLPEYIEVVDSMPTPVEEIIELQDTYIEIIDSIIVDTTIINRYKELTGDDSLKIYRQFLNDFVDYNTKRLYRDTFELKVVDDINMSLTLEEVVYKNKIFSKNHSYTNISTSMSNYTKMKSHLYFGGDISYGTSAVELNFIPKNGKHIYEVGYDILNKSPKVGLKFKIF